MSGVLTCFILHAHIHPLNSPDVTLLLHHIIRGKLMFSYVRDVQQQYIVIPGREWYKGTQLIPELVVAMNKFAPNHVI